MQNGQEAQPHGNTPRSRSWLGYGLTLGGIIFFILPLAVGMREIIREVPAPALLASPAGIGPIGQTTDEGDGLTTGTAHLQSTTSTTTATTASAATAITMSTTATATSVTTCATGATAPQKGAGFTPHGFTGFQSLQDQYLDYLQRKSTLTRQQATTTLKALSERLMTIDQEYFAFLRQRKLPMPGDQWPQICNFRNRLRSALDLEPMIMDQDWESAAYYCRFQQYSYRWETELYFLKKMGPRGYLMVLKRAPQHWWEEFRWGKMRNQIMEIHGDPRY